MGRKGRHSPILLFIAESFPTPIVLSTLGNGKKYAGEPI